MSDKFQSATPGFESMTDFEKRHKSKALTTARKRIEWTSWCRQMLLEETNHQEYFSPREGCQHFFQLFFENVVELLMDDSTKGLSLGIGDSVEFHQEL
jgi:hypothetical protein